MRRSEVNGFAAIIVALIILGLLMAFLFVPSLGPYLPGSLIGVGTLISLVFLGIAMFSKE